MFTQKSFFHSAVFFLSGLFSLVSVVAHAASATIVPGHAFTLAANVAGTAPFTYQWYKDGAVLSGATTASYQVSSAQTSHAGVYSAVISNSAGSTTSDNATIALASIPVITTQPGSQAATAGSSVTFSAAASGVPAPTYQWKFNGTTVSGATGAALFLSNVQSGNAGTYTLVATNSAGSITSAAATLTVNAATVVPAFTSQPASQTVNAGGSVTFSSMASGTPTPSYQWRKNGIALSGATASSYSIASVASADAGTYTVVATNSAGSATSNSAVLTVNTAPTITTQPANQTVTAGATVTFAVAATGSPAPTCQWKLNGAALSGATSVTLSIANAQSANAGTYTVVVSNAAGSATSSGAILTVNPLVIAPSFTTQPLSQTVLVGSSVTFTALANGSPAPVYQWRNNGVTISGATGASYSIANVTLAAAGSYTVVATNSAGSTTSNAAVLTVSSAPTITTQPVGQTVAAGAAVTFSVSVTGTPAPTCQWKLNGTAIPGATGATWSIASAQSANAGTYTVVASNSAGSVTSTGATLTVNPLATAPVFTSQPIGQTVTVGNSVTLTVAASGLPAPTFQWKLNGAALSGATSTTLLITNVQSANAGTYTAVAANSAGSVTSVGAIVTVNSLAIAPVFTTQPVSLTVNGGNAATFAAIASGTPAPAYQWQKNGSSITGATKASLVIANASFSDAGTYKVIASNSAGATTSSSAILTVKSAPVIITQPIIQSAMVGTNVTFTVVASGSPTLSYRWKRNGSNFGGNTNATVTITNVQAANAGTYTVVVTNKYGSVTSYGAVLTVTSGQTAPVFTTQPVNQTVPAGTAVTFTALANGSPTPNYQWRINGIAISGATGASFSIPSATSANAGTYSVIATNSAGSAASAGAVLTVNAAAVAPVFTTQPTGQTVTAGGSATLTSLASGTPAPTYQWYQNGAPISGATSAVFTRASLVTADSGSYTVTATNSAGAVTSNAAILTINSPPNFTTQPVGQTVVAGTSVTFTASANGAPTPTYQWRKDGVAIVGATGLAYTLAGTSTGDAGTYTVVATNSAGAATSASAVLTVNPVSSPVVYRVDFNSDGNSDILFQNMTTGDWRVWLMSGTTGYSMITIDQQSLQTRICGAGDFNSDGKSDILWQNSVTGECGVWLMSDLTVATKVSLGAMSLDWQLRGSGDFNGDGKSDILWQNSISGECNVWLMSGTTVSGTVSLGQASIDLMLTGTGDFNHDGQSDILWQDSVTGSYGVWLMTGTTVSSSVTLGMMSLDWQMSGAGDFNGDTNSDILWQNLLTGEGRMWLMNGTALNSDIHLFTVTPAMVMRN